MALGWRHGLGLFFHKIRFEVLVWDPVAGHQHLLAVPPDFEFQGAKGDISGAVLRAAGDADHFRVVMVGSNGKQPRTVLACVYSSEAGAWGDFISAPLPPEGLFIFRSQPAVLAGGCLHWSLTMAGSRSILKFDLNRKSLDLRLLPGDYYTPLSPVKFAVMRAEGGGMGFLFLFGFTAELWSLNPNRDGVMIWEPGRSIELDKLLRLNPEKDTPHVIGYAEENNVVFFWTVVGVFMVHLDSWWFKKLSKTSLDSWYHPFEIAYTPGKLIFCMQVEVSELFYENVSPSLLITFLKYQISRDHFLYNSLLSYCPPSNFPSCFHGSLPSGYFLKALLPLPQQFSIPFAMP
uniref:F-box associated domain-containing protein n=1 Tax=Aegilops tauschii TaxID=37682 RepID=M8BI67_AEGTA